ncbi:hypothetical protein GTP41_05440 [Pseudoduganella sp. DS3]|uniref:Uncharacterized protein n=1 Tax=Pseudoduganella guangdongensis TaxID=2692179 RepID=A0A6N9HDB3_9BURK|nr:hypothetical protein [Pseudoduganella guangdongensis]
MSSVASDRVSRRIDETNRLAYEVHGNELAIISCR